MGIDQQEKQIILIKLGGSVITDKTKPETLRIDTIRTIAKSIHRLIQTYRTTYRFIIGNGAGSFGHYHAKNNTSEDSHMKVSTIQDAVARLNRNIITAFLDQGIPAISIQPSALLSLSHSQENKTGESKTSGKVQLAEVLGELAARCYVPVIYGDIVPTNVSEAVIYSTEKLFEMIVDSMPEHSINKVIHLTSVNGVMDSAGNTIPVITRGNWATNKTCITDTHGFDVTGGMLHKVESALRFADQGIETIIIRGSDAHVLSEIIETNCSNTRQSEDFMQYTSIKPHI